MKSALLTEFLEFKFLANNFVEKLRSHKDRNDGMCIFPFIDRFVTLLYFY